MVDDGDDGDDGDDYGWGAVTDLRQLNLNDDLKPWIGMIWPPMVWCGARLMGCFAAFAFDSGVCETLDMMVCSVRI